MDYSTQSDFKKWQSEVRRRNKAILDGHQLFAESVTMTDEKGESNDTDE